MKTINFDKLGANTAAALNSGTIGVQKDKIVHLDPVAEILYDPEENIRNGKLIDDSLDSLVALRLGIDEEQLQPIRVYPLPAHKLDPAKPAMKYGIGFGHRRTLACRLTSEDSPLINGKARKVNAVIDVNWLKKGRAYRLRCQIRENTHRVDLNPVELGQALREYQRELTQEEGRHVSQADLMEAYDLKEKTVYNLLKAAEFHQIAKDVCHRQLLNDLDTMVTFDAICKANVELGQAIFESLQKEGAPSNRSLIRKARMLADDKDFVFDPETWEWPGSVENVGVKPSASVQAPAPMSSGHTPSPNTAPVSLGSATGAKDADAGTDQASKSQLGAEGGHPVREQTSAKPNPAPSPAPASEDSPGSHPPSLGANPSGSQSHLSQSQNSPQGAPNNHPLDAAGGPIIMVEFKMGAEASVTFTGELLVAKKAKGSSNGVVAYLHEGREEQIEVPLQLIRLLSINH